MQYTDEDVERVALKICEAIGDWNSVPMNNMAYEDAARAALSAMPRRVPEGWVLVPVVPTKEMRAAGSAMAWHREYDTSESTYAAMIAAALECSTKQTEK